MFRVTSNTQVPKQFEVKRELLNWIEVKLKLDFNFNSEFKDWKENFVIRKIRELFDGRPPCGNYINSTF